jgi:LytS/YehU family sensor histidine kinase
MYREIAYLENYISLQRLRIQASPVIVIEDNIGGQQCNHQVAPMLLIPFIENAFKHGISLKEDSWIKIKLVCDASTIHFEVRNSIHTYNSNDPEQTPSGTGMQNVRERLQLVYPGRHTFQANNNGKEFVVRLSVRP